VATNLVVPYIGCEEALANLIAEWGTLTIHLFSNNVTVSDTTVIANLTECTFGGYAAQTIGPWTAPASDGGNGAYTQAPLVTWTPTGSGLPQNVYGYYVTDAGGNLRWAQNDPNAPVVLSNTSQTYGVVPYFDVKSQY